MKLASAGFGHARVALALHSVAPPVRPKLDGIIVRTCFTYCLLSRRCEMKWMKERRR